MPIVFDFHSKTFDVDIGHSTMAGERHILNYGGNVRRNTFDLGVTPAARDRTEVGGYIQDEIFLDPFRIVLGGRIDKFGSVSRPFFSPRLALMYKPGRNHSLTVSYNRAFRSPSLIENYLDMRLIQPIDLSGLAALRPLLPQLLPPGLSREDAARALAGLEYQLDETTSRPFPLITRVAGNEVRVGDERRRNLDQESLTATELSYTGMFPNGTTVGAAVYRNRRDGQIKGGPLDPSLDPYTVDNPPPGWLLPPQILGTLAQFGSVLPRTALSFFNRGPTADVGTELWVDQRLSDSLSAAASYSWQGKPRVLDADNPFPANELSLPPTHRLNVSTTLNSRRFIASAAMSTATRAFWSDVLTPEFHGYSKGYKMINGSFGVKWANGTITTMLKVTIETSDKSRKHLATLDVRSDVGFCNTSGGCQPDQIGIVLVKDHIDKLDVAAMVMTGFYLEDEGADESDSTQRDEFEEAIQNQLAGLLLTSRENARRRIRNALDDKVASLLPKGETITIRYTPNEACEVEGLET